MPERILSPNRCVLKYKQDDIIDKDEKLDNVQERNNFTYYLMKQAIN
jgi:hypothetical protein